jgi:type IV secretory pathway VirB3-like protein
MEPAQLFGIGEQAFALILMITTVLAGLISIWCIGLGVIALLVTKHLCKEEPFLIDFLSENLNQATVYRG